MEADILKELGFDVVSEPIDFYQEDRGEIIVTNPPFSDCKNVFERLATLDKPFIMILPVSKMNTNYFRDWLTEMEAAHPEIQDHIQIIVPRKRIQFIKIENGKKVEMKSCCNYYCHRINLPKSIIHLPEVKPETKSELKPVKVKADATVCKGFSKKGKPCQNKVKCGEFCFLHLP